MITILVLLFISPIIIADLYRIVSLNDTNQINLQNNICYMINTNHIHHHWCELITSKFTLSINKICISINESFPIFNNLTIISEWIEQSIATTNCSSFLSLSMTISQKRMLTIIQSILFLIFFLPFLVQLILIIIQYYFY